MGALNSFVIGYKWLLLFHARFGASPTTLKYAANTEKCEVIDYVDFSVKI